MAQARLALRPDGLFLAAMFGGDTVQELRIACAVAQQEREGGVSPFVSPLAQVGARAGARGAFLAGAGMYVQTDVQCRVLAGLPLTLVCRHKSFKPLLDNRHQHLLYPQAERPSHPLTS